MDAKEKALEIMNKMRLFYGEYLDADGEPKNHYKINKSDAKQCALIAVEEILKIVPSVYLTNDEEIHSGHYQYWHQVKSHLQNL